MKTLKDLTPEIRSKIPQYISKVRDDLYSGAEHETNKREDTVQYIEMIYDIAGQDKPVVVIADNSDQYKVFFELLKKDKRIALLWKLKNRKPTPIDINKKLHSEHQSDLHSEIYSDLHSELNSELYSELHSELETELDLELNSELNSELYSELYSELKTELSSELETELDLELVKNKIRSHYLFLCNVYSRVYLTWYKFIQDEFQIKHSHKKVIDKLYELINKTFIIRCFFTKGYVLVLRTPNRIIRNNVGFHCIDGPAIRFKGNYEMYYINGRQIDKQLITGGFSFDDFIQEDNEDIKAAMLTIIKERDGQQGLMQFLNAEITDEQVIDHSSGHTETVKLWKTKETYSFLQDRHGSMNQPYCWTEMTCPSTGSVYLIENSPDFTDAVESMKFLRPQFVPQDMEYNFTQFNN